jgi:hypothetical protein
LKEKTNMVILRVRTDIPDSRRLVIDLPGDTPVGPADVEVHITQPGEVTEIPTPEIDVSQLPHYIDPVTGERRRVGRSGLVREVRTGP